MGSSSSHPAGADVRVEAVLLDLDGTLSDSGSAITSAVTAALLAVGHPELDAPVLLGFVGPPLEDSFAALPGFTAERVAAAVAAYRAGYDLLGSPLFDGVLATLRQLRAHGLRLALATSKPQPYAEQVVAAHGLSPLFEHVVGLEPAAGRSTKGDVVGEALRLLAPVGPAVMVGDREHDVRGAAEHGLPCVGALWGYGGEAELRAAGATLLAARPADLVRLLTGGTPTPRAGILER